LEEVHVKRNSNTLVRLAVVGLLAAPMVGCGLENAVGPVADAERAPVTSVQETMQLSEVIVDPGSPMDDAAMGDSPDAGSSSFVSGTGRDNPRHVKGPKKPKKDH
jgi:hypothetical protein